jgi:hypothetical protein
MADQKTTSRGQGDEHKGAVEQDKPEQKTNESMAGQLPHRAASPIAKGLDTDFPEPGENPEHSGELEVNPEGQNQTQDPGHAQKRNQGDKKDDDLAA